MNQLLGFCHWETYRQNHSWTSQHSRLFNSTLPLADDRLRRREQEELLPLAPTIFDAPVVLVAPITHISESQPTSIATVNGPQGTVFERLADIAAFGNASAGIHLLDWSSCVFAGIRPMSQTLSWSFCVAADTTGRAVARARRVYSVAWSCVVVFTVGLSSQFGFWYSRMCLFSGDLMTKRELNARRHAPAVL